MRRGKRRKFRDIGGMHCAYCDKITGGPYDGQHVSPEQATELGFFASTGVCDSEECQRRHFGETMEAMRARHPELSDEEWAAARVRVAEAYEEAERGRPNVQDGA